MHLIPSLNTSALRDDNAKIHHSKLKKNFFSNLSDIPTFMTSHTMFYFAIE